MTHTFLRVCLRIFILLRRHLGSKCFKWFEPDSNPISTINQGMCCVTLLQSCLTLFDPMDCSPPGSSVHGILQARIMEWIARPSSRESSRPRDWTLVSYFSCIGGMFFSPAHHGKPPKAGLSGVGFKLTSMKSYV